MNGDGETTPSLVIRRRIRSTPEAIFELWTDPVLMARWMGACPNAELLSAEADVRVGGTFRLVMGSDKSHFAIEGRYIEVRAPHRLVFTWSGPTTELSDTLVSLDLTTVDDGTELVLTHEKFPNDAVRSDHQQGWMHLLDQLAVEAGSTGD